MATTIFFSSREEPKILVGTPTIPDFTILYADDSVRQVIIDNGLSAVFVHSLPEATKIYVLNEENPLLGATDGIYFYRYVDRITFTRGVEK